MRLKGKIALVIGARQAPGEGIGNGPAPPGLSFSDAAKSVKAGYDVGICIEKLQDLKERDVIETYKKVEVAREE